MSVSTFKSVHLAERPKDSIIPGETFTLKTGEAPKESDLKDGEVLFQSLYLSLDPAMRGWLNGEFAWFVLSICNSGVLHFSSLSISDIGTLRTT